MRLGRAEIPDSLASAHADGQLVLFVGAGASRAAPSELPDFLGLVNQILEESGKPVIDPDDPNTPPLDRVLGDLDRSAQSEGVDVHGRIAKIIGAQDSSPNDMHRSIAQLARSAPSVRIVTTNYDRHLSTVLQDVDEFAAPALPLGADFEGLVYLHGHVGQASRWIVATDADFGRAYLTEAWASRFLERMFSTYAVLFVGYSHNDVVMDYLARGLPPESKRFALISDDNVQDWRRLNIRPVTYEQDAQKSHASGAELLDNWAANSSQTFIAQERRVAQLLASPPSGIPDEMNFLERIVGDPDKLAFFTNHARDVRWLEWALQQDSVKPTFQLGAMDDERQRTLATWFANHFVLNDSEAPEVYRLFQSMGGELRRCPWMAISQAIEGSSPPIRPHLGVWVLQLLAHAPIDGGRALVGIARACVLPENRNLLLLLVERLSEPRVYRPRGPKSWIDPLQPIQILGDEESLAKLKTELLDPNADELSTALLDIADANLVKAMRLQAIARHPSSFDILSFRRNAIEPLADQGHKTRLDFSIDLARDSMLFQQERDPTRVEPRFQMWIRSEVALLRRVAIHCYGERADISNESKLAWLTNTVDLSDAALRHETYRLIANALPGADEEAANKFVMDARATFRPRQFENERQEYNFLHWVLRHSPNLENARAGLADIQRRNPSYEASAHPDYLTHHSGVISGFILPMTPPELHEALASEPATVRSRLEADEEGVPPGERISLDDSLELIRRVVQEWPHDGFKLLSIYEQSEISSRVFESIAAGWAGAALDSDTCELVAGFLGNALETASLSVGAVSRFLRTAIDPGRTSGVCLGRLRELARTAWRKGQHGTTQAEVLDDSFGWTARAINHWAGNLAEFWIHSIAAEWRKNESDWTGLQAVAKEALEKMLDGAAPENHMARTILVGQLHFLFSADEEWCVDTLFRSLEWSDPGVAESAWSGFLEQGRWSDPLLDRGLLDLYLKTAGRMDHLSLDNQEVFAGQLASVALKSDFDLIGRAWIPSLVATLPPSIRERWAFEIAWQLRDVEDVVANAAWIQWIRKYWTGRLEHIGPAISPEESSAMAAWAFSLRSHLPEAAELAVKTDACFSPHDGVLYHLDHASVIDEHPDAVARLVVHLLKSTSMDEGGCAELRHVVKKLALLLDEPLRGDLVESAMRAGCSSAQNWR